MASECETRRDRGGPANDAEFDPPGARLPRRQRPPYTRRSTQPPCWATQSRRDRIPRELQVSPYMVPISHSGHPSAPIGTPRHPHVPLGTHGKLRYVPPPPHLVDHDRYMRACYDSMHWPGAKPATWIPRARDRIVTITRRHNISASEVLLNHIYSVLVEPLQVEPHNFHNVA